MFLEDARVRCEMPQPISVDHNGHVKRLHLDHNGDVKRLHLDPNGDVKRLHLDQDAQ